LIFDELAMMDNKSGEKENVTLLRVLTAQYNALVAAGASESLLREYSALLRFWRLIAIRF
jgi:hypothetical protein